MTVSRRTRFEVLRRDNHTCRYCGASAPDVQLTVDHVIPEALGGSDDPRNLVTACQPCNSGKSSIAPDQAIVEDVDATALLFQQATEKVLEQRLKERGASDADLSVFDASWRDWTLVATGEHFWRPEDWKATVLRFLASGLTVDELCDNIDIALAKPRTKGGNEASWRYFCGVCWKQIGEIQEAARRLIEDGEV